MKLLCTGSGVLCLCLCLCGCGSLILPSGNPPDGAVVQPQEKADYDLRGAENLLIVELAAYCASAGFSDPMQIDAAPEKLRHFAGRVVAGAGTIAGIRIAPLGRWHFSLTLENGFLLASLHGGEPEKILFSRRLKLKKEDVSDFLQ